jgi:hypothetical protein
MRKVLSQLGRAVSVVTVVVLLAVPTSQGAGFLRSDDDSIGRSLNPIVRRLIRSIPRWMTSIVKDDLIVPRP